MLTQEQILSIYAGKNGGAQAVGKVFTKTGWQTITKTTTFDVGSFQGRAGTMRRRAKGGSARMPNGSRKFIAGDPEVIAYIMYR